MRHSIKLSEDIPENTGDIIADERKIKQVILNLLGNAFKFTPDGGSVSVQARLTMGEGRGKKDERRRTETKDERRRTKKRLSS